jgi:hypothetical protein
MMPTVAMPTAIVVGASPEASARSGAAPRSRRERVEEAAERLEHAPRRRPRRPARAGDVVHLDQVGGHIDAFDHLERLHAHERRPERRPSRLAGSRSACRSVREHLTPQRAPGEAARRAHLRISFPASRIERRTSASCRQTPRGRAHEVLAPVRPRQPDVGAARLAAPVRGALGQERGHHEQVARAGRSARGELEQLDLVVRTRARAPARRSSTAGRGHRC